MKAMVNKVKEASFLFGDLGRIGFIVALLSFLSPIVIYLSYFLFNIPGNLTSAGPIGDFIAGTMVPFLTFASTLILISTLRIQLNELAEQKQVLNKQNATLELQKFENTFFQLINTGNTLIEDLSFKNKSIDCRGRQVFPPLVKEANRSLYYKLSLYKYNTDLSKEELYKSFNSLDDENKLEYYEKIANTIQSFHIKNNSHFSHYLRFLYRTIKFIDEYPFTDEENKNKVTEYVDILRAPLSADMLGLLYYNMFTLPGLNFIKYVKKYDLFDNLIFDDIQSNPSVYNLYQLLLKKEKDIVICMRKIEAENKDIGDDPEVYSKKLIEQIRNLSSS